MFECPVCGYTEIKKDPDDPCSECQRAWEEAKWDAMGEEARVMGILKYGRRSLCNLHTTK